MHKYNIQADWRLYSLCIVVGDQERRIGLEEKPLVPFRVLESEGKKPMFKLQKIANATDLPPLRGAKSTETGGKGAFKTKNPS